MALHPQFPESPYAELLPEHRWFPGADERETAYERLLPPLVAKIRSEVKAWRDAGYTGASSTSRALLNWWFATDHLVEQADGTQAQFRYYFAQREAVETVIWLHDARRVRDKFDLLRFDSSGAVSHGMFPEDWPRFVVKMATGAGKTKVLSLLIAWSYFHKLYEPDSTLARNFLLIAPNIIVLDRLRHDFDGLRIFFADPVLPDNGIEGHNWRDDFQLALHIQDDVRVVRPTGNLFLTNIHRVYLGDVTEPSLDDDDLRDYFLAPFGPRPVGKTTDSRIDLGEIVREIDELAVFNDEGHADGLELKFAAFLDDAPDVQAFAKNYMAVGFKLDYVKADGDLSTYTPDFIVRTSDGTVWIVETKGREELDVPQKMARLAQWCTDASAASRAEGGAGYLFVYVDQEGFERHRPTSFAALASSFTEYQRGGA